MSAKPPIARTGRSGWFGHRATRLKSLAVVGTVTLGFAGAALVAATPASADPAFQFVQVGSDTTQYVMDAFAGQVGGGTIGEYDAVNPSTQVAGEAILPQIASPTVAGAYSSCDFTRPNGSGGGYKAMAYSFTFGTPSGTTTLGQAAVPPQAGCVQIDRSSSPPGSVSGTNGTPGSSLPTGNFVYIPYAVDAVTYGTGPTSATTTAFAFTSTAAAPAVFTAMGNNFFNGEVVTLAGTTIPGGFTAGTGYTVLSMTAGAAYGSAVGNTFELVNEATPNGPITGTSTGSGTVQFAVTSLCVSTTTGCTGGSITFNPQPTLVTQGLNLSTTQLNQLYGLCQSVTVGSTTLSPVGQSFSFTVTNPATPAVFTAVGSAFAAGTPVQIGELNGATTVLPAPFAASTTYFVVNPSGDTFQLAATSGGAAINSTDTRTTVTFGGTVATQGTTHLYAPQSGSGTLAFWELKFGVSSPAPCWHQTILAGPAVGVAVEEHDGTAVASDPNGIEPISIARWKSGSDGVTKDLRHGIVMQAMTGTDGTTVVNPLDSNGNINVSGCLASGIVQASCFPLTRELYNVMDFFQVNNVTATGTNNPTFSPVLAGLFAGASSVLCSDSFTISNQGFSPIFAGASFPDTCGSTAASLRTQMNNASTNG